MIIPIGHEDSETRRLPWVTISLIALCFAVWVATLVTRANMQVLSPEYYRQEALRFWQDHPYLELDEALAFYMLEKDRPDLFERGDRLDFSESDWEAWLNDKRVRASFGADDPSPDGSEREELAAELERLTDWGFYLRADEIPPEGDPIRRFGLVPADPTWYGFVSHIFLHASWAHVLGNLFLFFLVAPAMEDRWGRPLFAAFYLVAGIFAGAFFAVLSSGSTLPLVGASGAIAAVLGSFLVLYWRTKIKFMYFFFLPPVVGTFRVAAWFALPLWLVNEMLGAFASDTTGTQGGVAYWAHVGGFLFGSAFALCVRGFRLEEKYLNPMIEWKVTLSQGKDMVEAGRRALEEGIYEEAFILFQQEASNRPGDLDSVLGCWESAVAFNRPSEGSQPLLAWIRNALAEGQGERAAEVWCRAVEIEPTFPVDGATLFKLAPLLEEMGRRDSAVLALRHVLSSSNPALTAAMALRARQLAARLDPATELLALHRILALAELPVEKEERVRARVAELSSGGAALSPDPFAPAQSVAVETVPFALPPRPQGAVPAGKPRPEPAAPSPAAANAAPYDPLGLRDGRAIEIDLDDGPPAAASSVSDVDALPPAVDESDMSYFGDNSAATEPLGLEESFESATTIGQPLAERAAPQVAEPTAGPADLDIELGGPASLPRFRGAKRSEVVPVGLAADHLVLQTDDGNRSKLELRRIQGIACAVVEDVSAKPILIIDLLLNWSDTEAELLQVVRIRSNTFDPRVLLPNAGVGMEALRGTLAKIQQGAAADALPSAAALAGQPFARFGRLVDYEREVLDVAES